MTVEARISAAAIPKARKKPLQMGRLFCIQRVPPDLNMVTLEAKIAIWMRTWVPFGVVTMATQGGDGKMIDSNRKEDLSESYLEAIAAISNISMTRNRRDENGIDVFLTRDVVREDGVDVGVTIELQLKSTSMQLRQKGNRISYDLDAKNYRDLKRKSTNQRFLALLVLPENEPDWVTCSTNE